MTPHRHLTPRIKTRDIQNIFKEYESERGGFRIKWLDDVNAMVVFADAGVGEWRISPVASTVQVSVVLMLAAKKAYLGLILNPSPSLPSPATVRPYDRPDATQIIASLQARAMGHRASMSSAMQSGNFAGLAREDGGRNSTGGLNGFKMPLNPSFSFGGSAQPGNNGRNGGHGRMGSFSNHQRAGSASSNWNRQSLNGALGFGNGNNPPSLGAARLPTHSEASSNIASRSTSSADSNDPIVVVDGSTQLKSTSASLSGNRSVHKGRRESVSAEKALREVEKALQSVEAQ